VKYQVYREISDGCDYYRFLDKSFETLKEAEEYTEHQNEWVDSPRWTLMAGLIGYRERYIMTNG
jgi:hypothetical protein